jgi:hypothetical protein
MSQELPSDIEAELRAEFSQNIDKLRTGRIISIGGSPIYQMSIGGLLLTRDIQKHHFLVSCFTRKFYVEHFTRQDAEERIATAKEELETLVRLFPELREQMRDLDLAFWFCHEGMLIAKDEGGQFQYFEHEQKPVA